MEDVRAASPEELDPTANGGPTASSADDHALAVADHVAQSHPVTVRAEMGTSPQAEALTAPHGEPDRALQPSGDRAPAPPAELTATASTHTEPRSWQAVDASPRPVPGPAGAEPGGEIAPEPEDDSVAGNSGPSGATKAEPSEADDSPAEPSPVKAAETEPDVATGDDPRPARSGKGARTPRLEQLEREGEVAADFLERLLDIADLDGDIEVDIDGDRAAVAVVDSEEGRVPRRLVGPDGRVLEALQELTRLAVETVTGERSRLMLDVASYRAQRRAALVELAKAAIAEVRQSGQDKKLEDMSAFERKVVHDEVTAAGLRSQSEGVEPHRHIVISPH